MKKQQKMNLFSWFLVIFAIIITIIGITNDNKTDKQIKKDGLCTEGSVVNSRLSSGLKAVSIEYFVNNNRYIITTNKPYKKGIKVKIKYSSTNPHIAKIVTDCD